MFSFKSEQNPFWPLSAFFGKCFIKSLFDDIRISLKINKTICCSVAIWNVFWNWTTVLTRPNCVRHVKQFISGISHHKRFIAKYDDLTALFYAIIRLSSYDRTNKCEHAYIELTKQILEFCRTSGYIIWQNENYISVHCTNYFFFSPLSLSNDNTLCNNSVATGGILCNTFFFCKWQ